MQIYLLNRVEKRDEIMDIIVQNFNNMEYVHGVCRCFSQ